MGRRKWEGGSGKAEGGSRKVEGGRWKVETGKGEIAGLWWWTVERSVRLFSLTCFVVLPSLWLLAQGEPCFSHIRAQRLLEEHPAYEKRSARIEAFTKNWIERNRARRKLRSDYRIPVVVHVVWKEPEENISDEQILSQIAVLNRDYSASNDDIDLVPEPFRALIADMEISFCLARIDPRGDTTSGITRTNTTHADIGTAQDEQGRFRIFYGDSGGRDAWDPERYLNIWVARRGYGSGLSSFPGVGPVEEDGLVIDYRFFGTTGPAADNQPYHLGRTVTHEIGHYFNLIHPWGRGSDPDCDDDDEVTDTPRQSTTYLRECPQGQPETCDTPDFFFNYMNYTDDACMAMFTIGQKMRMLAALEGPRATLLEQNLCEETTSFVQSPAPEAVRIWNDGQTRRVWVQLPGAASGHINVQLFNLLGQSLWQDEAQIYDTYSFLLPPSSSGVYLLRVQWGTRFYTRKLHLF